MNPILPSQYFIPDVEARIWKDGRIYLYGSADISGHLDYCSHTYRVFSSNDLIKWTDHGESFSSSGPMDCVSWSEAVLYAPDCIYRNGHYYLYFCLSDDSEGMAKSSNPYGPFTEAKPVAGAHKDGIDPAIFIDDDGETYLFWGQFHARGAKLKPNMHEIIPETLQTHLLTEKDHGFHEGSSIRKRNGLYYFIYTDISRGRATCLSYATSTSPLGPYTKRGVIIDNTGCDPETWNNHGSIAEFNDQWYIFYHRSSQGTRFNRRVCAEPIFFNEDGTIDEVEMTTQGVQPPIDSTKKLEAWRACLLSGSIKTHVNTEYDVSDESVPEYLASIQDGDWAGFRYLDFHLGMRHCYATVIGMSEEDGIELRLDKPNGMVLGVLKPADSEHNEKVLTCSCVKVEGVHALYLVFRGCNGPIQFKQIWFEP